MLWKEGLLIKLEKLSIKGRMYNWIKAFLIGRSIRLVTIYPLVQSFPNFRGVRPPKNIAKAPRPPPPTHTHTHTHFLLKNI